MAAASSANTDQPEEDASELIFPKGSAVLGKSIQSVHCTITAMCKMRGAGCGKVEKCKVRRIRCGAKVRGMNEIAMILSAFENRLRAGLV